MKKNNKIALVTGASQRIGKSIALGLSNDGWSVAIHYNKSKSDAIKVRDEIKKNQSSNIYYADLSKNKDCIKLINEVNSSMGEISCLVNNASIFERDEIGDLNSDLWDQHMEINLKSPVFLSQLFASKLINSEKGNIINIIDQRVLNLTPHFISYSVSKSGLWSITQILAQALAPKIRVNAIGPGPILPSSRQTEEDFKKQCESTPLGIGSTPEEIYRTIKYILQAEGMTGQMIALDGGAHLNWKSDNSNE